MSCAGEASALPAVVAAAGPALVDLHEDVDHNRSVVTLVSADLDDAVRRVASAAVAGIDLRDHRGAHPRIGALDVVPFVALDGSTPADAVAARDRFAAWAGEALELPCFLYGPERTLPEIRRRAWAGLAPDTGPHEPHTTAGACAVGARDVLVAYNLWLAEPNLATAKAIAAELRGPAVRALGLQVGAAVQVSLNLVDPARVGPADVYDAVNARTTIARAELVGLVPLSVLRAIDPGRWAQLDLAEDRTIEARVGASG